MLLMHTIPSVTAPLRGVAVEGVPVPVLWQQREAAIAEIGSSVFNGVTVERVIQDGAPAEIIARYVRERGVDLIVMPTHGYGGFRRVLLGSVTAKVLHEVRCPVWTTAHSEDLDTRCGQCIETYSLRRGFQFRCG